MTYAAVQFFRFCDAAAQQAVAAMHSPNKNAANQPGDHEDEAPRKLGDFTPYQERVGLCGIAISSTRFRLSGPSRKFRARLGGST